MSEDYYDLLGVDRDAPEESILRAYRDQAAKHHPDVNDDPDAEGTFRALNRAKAVLTDEERRRQYDRMGHDRFVEREGSGGRPPAGERAQAHDRSSAGVKGWTDPRPGPFASSGFDDLLAGWWRRPRRRARAADPWSPSEVDLGSFFESSGVRRSDRSTAAGGGAEAGRKCPKCRGRGRFIHDLDTGRGHHRRIEPCERCGGAGTVSA